MRQIVSLIILIFTFSNSLKSQEIFFEDLNGDNKTDILSITVENMNDMRIKQLYSGETSWKFAYLSEFYFNGSSNFQSYKVADINGNGRANLIRFLDNGSDKNIWFFDITPDDINYIGHTLLINSAGATEYFADIDGDNKKELLLVKDEGTYKYIYSYDYNGGDYFVIDTLITSGNPREEHFADITGDGKEDLILTQNYGADKRVWTFKSNGTSFEYLKYTNLVGASEKDVYFMNSNAAMDDFVDLVLVGDSIEGKKLWLFLSDGKGFNYEITNTLTDGINRSIYFGDIDGDKTDDLIATNLSDDVWSYECKDNVFSYKLHSDLNYTKVIPENRSVDWNNAGYRSGTSIPNSFNHIVYMPPPNSDPVINYSNLQSKLNEALTIKSINPNEHIVVQFDTGTYYFNNPIVLNYWHNHSYIVLKGQGVKAESDIDSNFTELIYNIDTTLTEYGNHFININGSLKYPTNASEAPVIMEYNEELNEITLDKNIDISDGNTYLLELLFTNGEWHYQPNWTENVQPDEYVGFISSAEYVSGTTYQLQNDFSLSWDLFKDETNQVKVYKFLPISEVGLINLSIRYNDYFENVNKDSINSSLIAIQRSQNCWLNNVEIEKILSAAVGIGESEYVEVRNSYFHEAYGYGGGGRGYGVVVGSRSRHCKVENNVFRKFRHSMMVQHGSNRNVFGYNYSREQTDQMGNVLGDLNLHGFYPYANLFEGNRVDRIHADAYWGSNGSFNTFFRNYSYYNQLRIDNMKNANIVANENAAVTGNDETTFQFDNYVYSIFNDSSSINQLEYLPDTSYYLSNMPEFFNDFINSEVTWPPIGPSLLEEILLQDIPARRRWFNSLSKTELKSTNYNNTDIVDKGTTKDLDASFDVYPNPCIDGQLFIKINNLEFRNAIVKVISITGKLVFQDNIQLEIDGSYNRPIVLTNQPKGLYFVSIITTNNNYTEKIILD